MTVSPLSVCLFLGLVCFAIAAPYPYTYCNAPSTVQETPTNYKLELVQTITRHGDRTTLTLLPGDTTPFFCNLTTFMLPSTSQNSSTGIPRLYRKNYLMGRNVVPGDCNFGQLTKRGLQQHLTLGANLRELYVNKYKFLSGNLTAAEVWIRSTDVYRTVQSVQGNMLGLFPTAAAKGEVPIVDMYTMDQAEENMVSNDAVCPRGKQLYNKLINDPEYIKYDKSHDDLRNQLGKALGIEPKSIDWEDLFDAFNVINCYDGPLPNGVTQDMVNTVYEIANWEYNYVLANVELVKLWLGSFANELVSRIHDKIAGTLKQKYMHYSGHDTTIAPLMTVFGVYDGRWPPYASHSQVELYSDNGNYYVQIKYQGIAQTLKGCNSTFCPLSQFIQNLTPYLLVSPKDCLPQANFANIA